MAGRKAAGPEAKVVSLEDLRILALLRKDPNDPEAWRLILKWHKAFIKIARREVGSNNERVVDELVQEAYARTRAHVGEITDRAGGYIAQTIRNLARDWRSKHKEFPVDLQLREPRASKVDWEADDPFPEEHRGFASGKDRPDAEAGPDRPETREEADAETFYALFLRHRQALEPQERMVAELTYGKRRSRQEIAQAQGLTVEEVRVIAQRVRRKLLAAAGRSEAG